MHIVSFFTDFSRREVLICQLLHVIIENIEAWLFLLPNLYCCTLPSVLGHCWLGHRNGFRWGKTSVFLYIGDNLTLKSSDFHRWQLHCLLLQQVPGYFDSLVPVPVYHCFFLCWKMACKCVVYLTDFVLRSIRLQQLHMRHQWTLKHNCFFQSNAVCDCFFFSTMLYWFTVLLVYPI